MVSDVLLISFIMRSDLLNRHKTNLGKKMKTIHVSAAIIYKENKIYATRRGKGTFKGLWEFPGGKREDGETGEETVIREIKEELDVEIKVESYLATIEYQYPDFFLMMDCYIASIIKGHLTLKEHDDAVWISLEEIDSLQWLPADEKVVKEIKKRIGKSC